MLCYARESLCYVLGMYSLHNVLVSKNGIVLLVITKAPTKIRSKFPAHFLKDLHANLKKKEIGGNSIEKRWYIGDIN